MQRYKDRRVAGENPRACLRDLVGATPQGAAPPPDDQRSVSFWVYSKGVSSKESEETLAKYRSVGAARCKRSAGRRGVTECSFAQDCIVCYDQLLSLIHI
eukprot:576994-Rhodomonas_salina.1